MTALFLLFPSNSTLPPLDIDALQQEITSYNIRFAQACMENKSMIRVQALKAHQELEEIIDNDDTLSKQLILRSRVLLGNEDQDFSFEEKKSTLIEAIRMTTPYFDLDDISRGLYTTDEIKIINQLELVYANAGERMDVDTINAIFFHCFLSLCLFIGVIHYFRKNRKLYHSIKETADRKTDPLFLCLIYKLVENYRKKDIQIGCPFSWWR